FPDRDPRLPGRPPGQDVRAIRPGGGQERRLRPPLRPPRRDGRRLLPLLRRPGGAVSGDRVARLRAVRGVSPPEPSRPEERPCAPEAGGPAPAGRRERAPEGG